MQMSRPRSEAGSNTSNVPNPHPQKVPSLAPSNISLFVSNLRLLDLDRRNDWPDISVSTFDTKDALQNQKKRITCVEWALYRLFELWDRETTRNKLQPFFPPLEPIQSLNLRSALFRCLNELKKNDVLGREATIRKTMLDECKGEKFDEILLLFSAAVVRKQVLSTRRKQPVSIGRHIATSQYVTKDDLNKFTPLLLVYRASLAKTLQNRANYTSALKEFQGIMQERQEAYQTRQLAVSEKQQSSKGNLSPDMTTTIEREVSHNWVGNTDGFTTLIDGTKAASPDAIMDMKFDIAWQHFRQGTTPKVAPEDVSLLETLQTRVTEQNKRLHQWKQYRDRFGTSREHGLPVHATEKPADQQPSTNDWNLFDRHRNIRIEQGPSEHVDSLVSDTAMQYEDAVTQMNESLARVRKEKQERRNAIAAQSKNFSVGRKITPVPVFLAGSKEPKNDLFSPLKRPPAELNSSPIVLQDTKRYRDVSSPLVFDQDETTAHEESNTKEDRSATSSPKIEETQTQDAEPISSLGDILSYMDLHEAQETPRSSDSREHSPDLPSIRPLIRSSTTSELPRRPTLAERTRMTMAFSSSEDIHTLRDREPTRRQEEQETSPASENTTIFNTSISLADRVRQSMTLANTDMTRRPSQKERPRSSFYPPNQFQTPEKARRTSLNTIEIAKKETTPRDKLFSEDAEYASVFKSRPRVVHSPTFSPTDEYDDLTLPDIDETIDMDGLTQLESSPLGGR